jgi:AAHS family 4-hydroxybenzoate transporter-like MFS transporter
MNNQGQSFDVARLIDEQPLSRFQIVVYVLCGLVALLDGMDTQSIGVAAPLIAQSLGMAVPRLGPVFSAALFGAMLGALIFGPLADLFGRKRVLIAATVLFGIFTFATALADSFQTLMLYRFLAGLGLGGATPCFIAMAAEFAPRRLRGTMAAALFAAFPLGGMLGGFLNSYIVANFGWQAMFYIGGLLPIAVAFVLAIWLPESLRFLLTRGEASQEVRAIMERVAPGKISDTARLVSHEEKLLGVPVKHLFTDGRAIGTLLLWMPFILGFGSLAIVVLWTPTLLRESNISPAATSFIVAFNGLGSFLGFAGAGKIMEKFGRAPVLAPAFVIGGLCVAGLGQGASSIATAALFMALVGFFISVGIAGAIAQAATVYPTSIRSTGIGWGMGSGRFGQTVSPLFAGALLGWGWHTPQILMVVGVAPIIAAVFVLLLESHTRAVKMPTPGARG